MLQSLPRWVLALIGAIANRWDWLGRILNKAIINATVNSCRHRPHIYSTAHDYVSWTSLTERRWSARHLPPAAPRDLPPVDQVLDLFRARDGGQALCPKSTLLFPTFAQYLTDGFIRTRMPHQGEPESVRLQNTSNHEIDLSPLYGRTAEQTGALRLRSETFGARGRLKTQTIDGEDYAPFLFDEAGLAVKSEFAALDPPLGLHHLPPEKKAKLFAFGGDRANSVPSVAAMNTLFLREHNRLASLIETANPDWDDERVFETARNTVIVLFIKIVIEEYINHIAPTPIRLRADPSVAWDAPWNKPNWITTEFSLLYRWHALIPERVIWAGRDYPVADTFMNNALLLNAGLGRAFAELAAQPATELGPRNTAAALLPMEEASVRQDRLSRTPPYADYRAYVKLKKPRRFAQMTKDKPTRARLKDLYGAPDHVEFFVGLFCETRAVNSPLPPLVLRMVAVDAFSQALTNPLLSRHAFNADTFSPIGWDAIQATHTLKDVLVRNGLADPQARIAMTRADWRFKL